MSKGIAQKSSIWLAIIISALGYFVDVYDIILFSAVRIPSLTALGVAPDHITSVGMQLINIQVAGMLIGGFFWGMLGDKRGRLEILFGSIALYSTATLLNAFVTSVPQYGILRFLAGVGLSGELGAGITLVSELMDKKYRGYGTMLIVSCGALGSMAGGLVSTYFSWQTAYIMGGLAGIFLLVLRMRLHESAIFLAVKHAEIKKGSFALFLGSPTLCLRYLTCLLIGLPFWLFVGLFVAFAPEIGEALKTDVPVTSALAITYYSAGLAIGELLSSLLSQWLKSRKKILQSFLLFLLMSMVVFLSHSSMSKDLFYLFCFFFGFGSGFWVLFLVISAEQFGTNVRATVTTTLPNLVRGLVIPCAAVLSYCKPTMGVMMPLGLIILFSILTALFAAFSIKETFAVNLNFIER